MNYRIDKNGYYGNFGGAYVPEMLIPNLEELRENYIRIIHSKPFLNEFHWLLHTYAGRPTPLYYADSLSKKYRTHIFLKREDLLHTGAHKINNTLGQILVALQLGKKRIIAETGAGQHGVATATVCALRGLECVIYMGEKDMIRQAPNVSRMKMLGAKVIPVSCGSKTLKDATNEAIRDWINHPENTHYIIGSVVGPHPYPDMVLRFQNIISNEIKNQLKQYSRKTPMKAFSSLRVKLRSGNPDYVIACVGGGSNSAGAFYHFLENKGVKLIGVEAAGKGIRSGYSAATMVLGKPGIIHGSKTLLMQTQDGQITEPYSISAGLDYPGVGPFHSHLFETGRAKYVSATDKEALRAGFLLAKLEGIIPALESAHALAYLEKLKAKRNELVVVNLSGRGDKDMTTYISNMK